MNDSIKRQSESDRKLKGNERCLFAVFTTDIFFLQSESDRELKGNERCGGKRGKSKKKISVVKTKNKYGVKAKENPKVMKDMGETKRESEVDERLCVCMCV